jgi:phosphatidylinositol transfer protein SFH5
MSADEKPTTAAPNNTTGQAETAVVPENKEIASEPGPTAATASAAAEIAPNGDAAAAAKLDNATTTADQSQPPPAPIQQLWLIAKSHDHNEIWGVQLADPETHVPSQIVFQKFLNAYDGDLAKAKDTLTNTLDWRKETRPLDLLDKGHKKAKFEGLGYVTEYGTSGEDPEAREVFTWNIYGGVTDINNTFGELDEYEPSPKFVLPC